MILLLVAVVLAMTPVAGAKEVDIEDEIGAAYAAVLDRSLPMRERVAALEDGAELRATLRELDDLDEIMGMEIRSVALDVTRVRAHDGDAEVQLSVFVNLYSVTSWYGVAHKVDGRWVAARATVCTLLMEWTPVRCPGGPKRIGQGYRPRRVEPTTRGGYPAVPLTFADGGRADLVIPNGLEGRWQVTPHAELVLNERQALYLYFAHGQAVPNQPVRKYPGGAGRPGVVLDAMTGLVFDLDGWTANVDAVSLSERERAQVARHLDGYTTKTDFPVLLPSGPLRFHEQDSDPTGGVQLVKSALSGDPTRNPIELWYYDKDDELSVMVNVTPGPCREEDLQPVQTSGSYHAEERCMPDGVGRISVEGGNSMFVFYLLDQMRVANYRPRPQTIST